MDEESTRSVTPSPITQRPIEPIQLFSPSPEPSYPPPSYSYRYGHQELPELPMETKSFQARAVSTSSQDRASLFDIYPSTPGYHLSHHQLPPPGYYQPSTPKSSHRPPQVFQPHATVFSPKQSVEQITARFHCVSDAGRMAVQLAVKHFFGKDIVASNTAGSLDSSKMRSHQDHHLGKVWGEEV